MPPTDPALPASGRIEQINVSHGGVPKRPVPSVRITRAGVAGDRQEDRHHHGGPDRAVCCFALEIIERLRTEGHPIFPGSTGENLTLAGLDWSRARPGARLRFAGGVELEITKDAPPCNTIRESFVSGGYERLSEKRHPGDSRWYCRVLAEGDVAVGESVQLG